MGLPRRTWVMKRVRMVGRTSSVLLLLLASCVGGQARQERVDRIEAGTTTSGPVSISEVLATVGNEVIVPRVRQFKLDTVALEEAASTWMKDAQDDSSREAVRDAWRQSMLTWQELEVMQVGPAGSSLTVTRGANLRDEIYSWPTVNPCRVDQETVGCGWESASYFGGVLVNVYGLDAMEETLFADDAVNACPSLLAPNEDGSWAALGQAGVRDARARHAHALASHVLATASELESAWVEGRGNYVGALAGAGVPGSPYASAEKGLNAVYDAMFYIEKDIKDTKLALPLGLIGCGLPSCPEDVELLLSGMSTEVVGANLKGFRAIFMGDTGVGFDDLLVEKGHGDLTEDFLAAMDGVDAAVAALNQPIDEALMVDREGVEALHSALGSLTDLLKRDLATVLSLEIPVEAAGDND